MNEWVGEGTACFPVERGVRGSLMLCYEAYPMYPTARNRALLSKCDSITRGNAANRWAVGVGR